jgi:hypothetical protein
MRLLLRDLFDEEASALLIPFKGAKFLHCPRNKRSIEMLVDWVQSRGVEFPVISDPAPQYGIVLLRDFPQT